MRRSDDKNMTTFGKNLWSLRKKHALRQEDLAQALGISRDMISYYECKAKNPTIEFVLSVADYFSVSTDELLRDSNEVVIKPGPISQIEKLLEQVRSLPKEKQKAVSTVLEMALSKS